MELFPANSLMWLGILFCISQSAMFSGLNLALLGISRLRLEVEAHSGNRNAIKILALRKDVNLLLVTILWGNVGINVLLTLLSNSVMAGVTAFCFSTILITFVGEILPQAYFSRHAMRMGAFWSPVIRFYQIILYPVTKPCAIILDRWLGQEGIKYFREQDLHTVIRKHIEATESDVSHIEGIGAMNFLTLDDIIVTELGNALDPHSVISLPIKNNKPVFPEFSSNINDPFLQKIARPGKKWVIITDHHNEPVIALHANRFIREAMFSPEKINPLHYCHRPIIVKDSATVLGKVLTNFKVDMFNQKDDVIENDMIIVWSKEKRVITGSDILGRLLRGIALRNASLGVV